MLASLVSQGNSLELTVVTRGNASPESAGPGVPQGVAVCSFGPLHRWLLSQRMSLRHHGLRAAGQKWLDRSHFLKVSTFRTFHGAAAIGTVLHVGMF